MFRALVFTLLTALPIAGAFVPTNSPEAPDGSIHATVDLPAELHLRNKGGSDGAGLCVFTAFEDACEYQGYTQMRGFRDWMTNCPGGGWPEKLEQMVKKFCAEKGVEEPPFLQHVGGDEDLLALAIKTRRAPCVTYAGMDDFYSSDIAHMVVLGEFGRSDLACILDNNRPGEWVWMAKKEFTFRWHLNTVGQGWAVILLGPPPPPEEDTVKPAPKPKPKPKPKPRRPFLPWRKVVFSDGSVGWKLFDEDGTFFGLWDHRGFHKAVGPDGWEVDVSPSPVNPPSEDIAVKEVSWYTDYEAALKASQESGKPLLVLFSSKHCGACRTLKSGTLKNETVEAKINALFTPVLLDDADPALLRNFGIQYYPTSIVIDKDRGQVGRSVGAVSVEEYLQFLQSTVKHAEVYKFGDQLLSKDEALSLLDDSDKWYLTVVVDTVAQKDAALKLLQDPTVKDAAGKVHVNVYTSDFWAAKRVKHAVTVQKPYGFDNHAMWTSDAVTLKTLTDALVSAGALKSTAPEPRPKIDPVAPSTPAVPDAPISSPVTVPAWLFWSVIGGVSYSIYHLFKR